VTLTHELGLNCELSMIDKFHYQAKYKNIGSENEICAVLVGKHNGDVEPNVEEVADWKWIELDNLRSDIIVNPSDYTPWLKIGLTRIEDYYNAIR